MSLTESNSKLHRATPLLIALAAWIVPGLGHLLLHRWKRALAFLVAAAGLAIVGCELGGEVFTRQSNDPFGVLGFIADAGSGILYFAARLLEARNVDLARAAGDYGTRFIAAAGIVNLLGVLDAYGIANGRRG